MDGGRERWRGPPKGGTPNVDGWMSELVDCCGNALMPITLLHESELDPKQNIAEPPKGGTPNLELSGVVLMLCLGGIGRLRIGVTGADRASALQLENRKLRFTLIGSGCWSGTCIFNILPNYGKLRFSFRLGADQLGSGGNGHSASVIAASAGVDSLPKGSVLVNFRV